MINTQSQAQAEETAEEKIVLRIPEYIDNIDSYLENRKDDISTIISELHNENFESIRTIAHNMMGSGTLYGIEAVTASGKLIERAALTEDFMQVAEYTNELSAYLQRLDIHADLKDEDLIEGEDGKQPEQDLVTAILIDDSDAARDMLGTFLEKTPVYVLGESNNGNEGLKACEVLKPDLVFLDVVMPGMSGVEVLEGIKKAIPETTIIMLTSISDRNTVLRCKELGASEYILKPFDRHGIIKRVNAVCERIQERSS